MQSKTISSQSMRRLPVYLHYLKSIRAKQTNVSATAISDAFGLNDVQVRKDLQNVSGSGRPKTGYNVEELIGQIEKTLGYGTETKTIIVGAGNLGKALLSYNGFMDFGLSIIAAFDTDPTVIGGMINGKPILATEDMEVVCRGKDIRLGIITTPVTCAQPVCDELIGYGIKAVWNFAPTILRVPADVLVENENLASSLAVLSRHLRENLNDDEEEDKR